MVEKHITISAAKGTWVVRAQGGVIAETKNALQLFEGSYDPVTYFPREDIGMIFLEDSDKTSHCPHKGDASYFHIEGKSSRIANAAWSYENPNEAVARIKGHIAFSSNGVAVEEL